VSIPERIEPAKLADYLAIMSRAIFQAGVSWKMIETRWDAYVRAFEGFDPAIVAAFGEGDVERIMQDAGIVRTRKKIVATIENARTMLTLSAAHGSFGVYLHSFGSYAELAADLKKRFQFLGELSAYYFLFRVGERVPHFEDWEKTVAGDHPRMREMIALARSNGYRDK
jgi:3-methyladenine DNA glycosylase Tag